MSTKRKAVSTETTKPEVRPLPAVVIPERPPLNFDGVTVSKTGMTFQKDGHLTEAAWQSIGANLNQTEACLLWLIGDWYNYGGNAYGSGRAYEMARATGLDYGTVLNAASVAKSVTFSRRREDLTWSHHAEVAKLTPKQQTTWLRLAAKKKMSTKLLRANIAAGADPTEKDAKRPLLAEVPKAKAKTSLERVDEIVSNWYINAAATAAPILAKVASKVPRPEYFKQHSEANSLNEWIAALEPVVDVHRQLVQLRVTTKSANKPKETTIAKPAKDALDQVRQISEGAVK